MSRTNHNSANTSIGKLASPYTPPEPPIPSSWAGHVYDYDDPALPGIPHAVKSVDSPGSDSTALTYDANGNMTCRVEVVGAGTTTWIYDYNDENRLWKIREVSGTCASPGSDNLRWTFEYDGDGVRANEDYYNGTTTITSLYFMGGMYEIQDSGGAGETIVRYYGIGGQRVARAI